MADLKLDLSRTAVLALDLQQGIISANQMAQQRNLLQTAGAVLKAARFAGVSVIFVNIGFRPGYPEVSMRNRMFSGLKKSGRFILGAGEAAIDKSLGPLAADVVVNRSRVNAFYNTELQTILSAKEIDTLVLMGIATEFVVETSARYAADADYRVIVLEDCCAGMSVESQNMIMSNILPRIVEVSSSADLLASLK